MAETTPGKSQLRSFGLIVAGGFTVIGLWPLVFRGQSVRLWALSIAAVMSVTGLILPQVLRPVFKVWMRVGEILGWVNTRIILSLLFYVVMVPMAVVLRLARKDFMMRRFDREAATYRIPRTKRPASHMQRQY
jgi:hypothetical protein